METEMTETNDMTDFELLENKANDTAREAERLRKELETARVAMAAELREQADVKEFEAESLRKKADEIDPPQQKRGCKQKVGTPRNPMQGPSQAEVVECVAGYPAFAADAIARTGGWDVTIVKRRLSAAARVGLIENIGGKGDAAQWFIKESSQEDPAVGEAQGG